MKRLFAQINTLDYGITGSPLDEKSIRREQSALISCGLPSIPADVIEFLKHYNGFLAEGRCIFGIDINKHSLYDLLAENIMADSPQHQNILLLGATSETYIAWQAATQNYLLIDKSTFMVLHTFKNFPDAARYILQIDD